MFLIYPQLMFIQFITLNTEKIIQNRRNCKIIYKK